MGTVKRQHLHSGRMQLDNILIAHNCSQRARMDWLGGQETLSLCVSEPNHLDSLLGPQTEFQLLRVQPAGRITPHPSIYLSIHPSVYSSSHPFVRSLPWLDFV